MLLIETEEGNIINKYNNHLEKGTDYLDDIYETNEYSDEEYDKEWDERRRSDDNKKDDLYDVNANNEYDY